MSGDLLQHWKDILKTHSNPCSKVYHFLIEFYQEQASRIAFPPTPPLVPAVFTDGDVQPKLPKSPEQIRSLLRFISEAVKGSAPGSSWQSRPVVPP